MNLGRSAWSLSLLPLLLFVETDEVSAHTPRLQRATASCHCKAADLSEVGQQLLGFCDFEEMTSPEADRQFASAGSRIVLFLGHYLRRGELQ